MRIVYHLGAHCTDDERLIRCLLKNRTGLAAEGIAVPSPTRYRKLLRDTAVQLKGAPASIETQNMILEQIIDGDHAERLVLSWESFMAFPQWALRGRLYGFAGERIHAFTQILPQAEAEFHLALRNPATFLPALFEKQKTKSYEEFFEGIDLRDLRWSDVILQILAENPGVPLVVWADEDSPMIWPEVLQSVSGHSDALTLVETDDLMAQILTPDGFARMSSYLSLHPAANILQRRRITQAFLEKFARSEQMEHSFDMPGWDQDLVDDLTNGYLADLEKIRTIPGVSFIEA